MGHGVEKHTVGFPGDCANVAFGKAILPVCANASKGLTLMAISQNVATLTKLVLAGFSICSFAGTLKFASPSKKPNQRMRVEQQIHGI